MTRREVVVPVLLMGVLGIFLWAVVGRLLALAATGEPALVGLACAAAILVGLIVYALVREWRLALIVATMGRDLAQRGLLPVDDLPRSPGGRLDRVAATEHFDRARHAVDASPHMWEAWYNLAFAYDAAGDRRRARATLRRAAALYRRRDDDSFTPPSAETRTENDLS